jgi:thymidylate kinase
LDAIKLRLHVSRSRQAEVIIFDRYFYDELANLPAVNRATCAYQRLLLRITPRPHLAFLLDADPVAACNRKPEYPLDFVERNRASFLQLAKAANMVVIRPASVAQVSGTVYGFVHSVIASRSGGAALATGPMASRATTPNV